MKLSVIITTYNAEDWLTKVLWGFVNQTVADFEVIVADDGSTPKTKEVVDSFRPFFKHAIVHVWQKDEGFNKCKILNKAILKTNSDYLLFTDGDCIPRNDFVATHLNFREKGYFLSGGYFKLPLSASSSISKEDIELQNCFEPKWLIAKGVKKTFKLTKLTKSVLFARFLNWVTPTKKTFNGHNTSCYKNDLLLVNGFNEEMQYGGLDRELGERLFNLGLLAKQIRYHAICVHLFHERSYAKPEIWQSNNAIRAFNKKNKITTIDSGIRNIK